MDAILFLLAERRTGVVVICLAILFSGKGQAQELRDAPVVWHENDRMDIELPEERDPNIPRDMVETSIFRPMGRLFDPAHLVRRVGTIFGGDAAAPAANVNSLDEVPNSTWFTNRIGLFPVTPEEAATGLLTGPAPSTAGPWTVVAAKTEGVTPGFTIMDAAGDRYLVKFDPPGYPGMTIAAGVIAGRILHAAGYNVPEDMGVTFRRDDLILGENVELDLSDGTSRSMTEEDLDEILESVAVLPDGSHPALASKFLNGIPVGPFDWRGTRKDDPNDRIDHEDRRELRGLRMFSGWLCHSDTKQGNTLDMYVEEDGRRFLRHHVIDFASSLGAGAKGPAAIACSEFSFDFVATLRRALSLGFYQDPWRRIERPERIDEIGYLESEIFEPMAFKPYWPNTAFAHLTDRDGYWAAKIISAFTDAHIEAIVAEGGYSDPRAARWMSRMLGERRDKIVRFWFDRVPPLDFFVNDGGLLRYHDLGAERGIYPGRSSRYRVRAAASTPSRDGVQWTPWTESAETVVELERLSNSQEVAACAVSQYPFLAMELQLNRGSGWSATTTAYVARASGRVVALER